MITPERVPSFLTAVTVGLSVTLGVEITNQLVQLGPLATVGIGDLPWTYIVSFLISAPFVVGIGYGARFLSREPFAPERNVRIFKWCLGGGAVWLGINALTMLSFGVSSFWPVVGWIRGAISWGCAFGLAIGIVEARAITKAIEAEQARLRAKHVKEQRDLIDYVNSLIRHEVLNGVNVIHGRAELLELDLPESAGAQDHVEPIIRRSEEIESVVKEVRAVMESVHDEPSLERRSLREVMSAEVEKVRDVNPNASVRLDVSGDVYVRADDTLGLVFGNLLTNAVEHTDSDSPTVTVSAQTDGEAVTVAVSDDGPGIDPDVRDGLFDRPDGGTGDHGFGLFLVGHICERYGGDIELTDTGPDGTTFTVRLPAAAETPDQPFESAVAAPPSGS